jgi:UDP-N-acetylglucosamine 4-epimerase
MNLFSSSESTYELLKRDLTRTPLKWLVTGAAGFIGSHLVQELLALDQFVVGLDNFSTGHRHNLTDVQEGVTPSQWSRFTFLEGDIISPVDCLRSCSGVNCILHQAALGSVPRSLADPIRSHAVNVDGFINMLIAARDSKVARFVYASSSSVYGDHPELPKVEANIGRVLSVYAATKFINEVYAGTFYRNYGLPVIGLRYFNVFGSRQDPNGPYAAVIPKWFSAARRGKPVIINGDGEASRDFCYVKNVVQANLLAATTANSCALDQVYNIAAGRRTTLKELFGKIRTRFEMAQISCSGLVPQYQPERPGDVRHSLADISLAQARLGYAVTHDIDQGLNEASAWYLSAS